MWYHLFLEFWLVDIWFFADWHHQRAVTCLENVRQLNIRWGKKLGFKLSHKQPLNINGVELTVESWVKLLGIEIDNKLNLEKHILSISKQASNRLNAICRLQTFMGHKEKGEMTNTFTWKPHSNFSYDCLIWYFSSK